jgi:hypothetical protein
MKFCFALTNLSVSDIVKIEHLDVTTDYTVEEFIAMTFSGIMAATIAGLLTSLATSGAKRLFGFIDGKNYVPGVIHLRV